MDPLSVAASVVTLVETANSVYHLLQSLRHAVRHADTEFATLCADLNMLTDFLESIRSALGDCSGKTLALAPMDDNLWKQSRVALSDCERILQELTTVAGRIKMLARSNILFRKARLAMEMQSRAREINAFRDKIRMSNCTLQTLLQVINVSISLRTNTSQDKVMQELKQLRQYLRTATNAATDPFLLRYLDEPGDRLVQNLKCFVRAAQDFHASASVTASTVNGDDISDDGRSNYNFAAILPSSKKRRLEAYLSQTQQQTLGGSIRTPVSVPSSLPEVFYPDTHYPTHNTLDIIFSTGFKKISQQALIDLDLEKAAEVLEKMVKRQRGSGFHEQSFKTQLAKTQLAVTYLLHGKPELAETQIIEFVQLKSIESVIRCQLLYCLALSYMHNMELEAVERTCKTFLDELGPLEPDMTLRKGEILRLLATSYRFNGESLLADALECQQSQLAPPAMLPTIVDFVVCCEELITDCFGVAPGTEPYVEMTRKLRMLPIALTTSTLQTRHLAPHERTPRKILSWSWRALKRNTYLKDDIIKSSNSELFLRHGSCKTKNVTKEATGLPGHIRQWITSDQSSLQSNQEYSPQIMPPFEIDTSLPPGLAAETMLNTDCTCQIDGLGPVTHEYDTSASPQGNSRSCPPGACCKTNASNACDIDRALTISIEGNNTIIPLNESYQRKQLDSEIRALSESTTKFKGPVGRQGEETRRVLGKCRVPVGEYFRITNQNSNGTEDTSKDTSKDPDHSPEKNDRFYYIPNIVGPGSVDNHGQLAALEQPIKIDDMPSVFQKYELGGPSAPSACLKREPSLAPTPLAGDDKMRARDSDVPHYKRKVEMIATLMGLRGMAYDYLDPGPVAGPSVDTESYPWARSKSREPPKAVLPWPKTPNDVTRVFELDAGLSSTINATQVNTSKCAYGYKGARKRPRSSREDFDVYKLDLHGYYGPD
ncbi:hypothetical protein E0Z10_g4306 [Xylaria hypoxylon]|uniref:Fungal N-terminal domain-containing protein n=1 Tax=Xylaria hypoxylon TaxID=37992 RepID=A0A4Z0YJE0_9PEZI|nr:hypothetical protein E0Z10_g4306 [Xylaria hypoxylon]